ncbi:hypothetical protein RvVAR0630_34210 [Agrobacterium vitis]|uniref:class I SAM-dependent methyltransferase n=1 Tax=Agrobacterium vitis TaxID=373 RepID=UPI0015D8BF37|nr:class I SAM-dependent methyltransferase [Agrobacterium vitis]BCH60797.1 hypothetical protein RvVAR0630_34210 [Agrobacterium vitis]
MNDLSNLWADAASYERTSKKLQKQYLQTLLDRGQPSGRVLDVGCGTGNAYEMLERIGCTEYVGVDISPQMVEIAKSKATSSAFYIGDFLQHELPEIGIFDHVICAACLHWFHPNQKSVIKKIRGLLRDGGSIHMSSALAFSFLPGENSMQTSIINQVRERFPPIAPVESFDSRRLSTSEIPTLLDGFSIAKISFHEEKLDFSNYDDFRDWHVGSGSVVGKQFTNSDAAVATEMYYSRLYEEYVANRYQVSYGTTLINAQKI